MTIQVTGLDPSQRFVDELSKADRELQVAVKAALDLLKSNPRARSLRLHNLQGYAKPTIWKIDVYTNKSWQITFELDGGIAKLKRLGTHKSIDREPR